MQNLEYKLRPSKFYCIFLAIAILASFVVITVVSANFWLKLIVFALLAGYGSYTFLRYGLLKAKFSIIGLQKMESGQWQVTTNSGVTEASLRGDSTITPIVSILRFDVSGRKVPVSCIIFKDSLTDDGYRRLIGVMRMS